MGSEHGDPAGQFVDKLRKFAKIHVFPSSTKQLSGIEIDAIRMCCCITTGAVPELYIDGDPAPDRSRNDSRMRAILDMFVQNGI
jgi:hypothetical protein